MRRAGATVVASIGAVGLIVTVVGTFLPWLRSGEVRRNSYTSFGLLRRLIGFPGPAELLLRAWPLLGAVCAVVVLVAVVVRPRFAAGLALLVAAWSASVAGGALAHDAVGLVRVDALGPIVTLSGGAASAVAAILALTSRAAPAAGGIDHERASRRALRPKR
jgi:predicted anti-sigma-YlaC factor YlaD